MGINLQKGQKIDLTKGGGTGLSKVMVGLGWDEAQNGSGGFLGGLFGSQPQSIDCDASVILCGDNNKLISKDPCVYYGNLKHSSGAIVHQGDNLTGAGDGDDEQIMVNLQQIPTNIEKMVFVVNIYDGRQRKQHFGMIRNAFIRLVDLDTRNEICRFNLSENYTNMTGLIVGEIYKKDGEWKFNAIGQPVQEASRIDALLKLYS
ncbi:TerD family protein [Fusibacter bizertensis]